MNYREQLIKNILPFWLEHAIDHENGGIYTCLNEEGVIYGQERLVSGTRAVDLRQGL